MKQTLEITGNVTDIRLNGKSVYKQEPDNDLRMRCLRGEYEPKYGETVYAISLYGTDRMPQIANEFATNAKALIAKGCRFFPTPELRAEYKTIPLGKWLPKAGDEFVTVRRKTLEITDGCIASMSYTFIDALMVYFPSVPQAQAWIDAQTVEPLDTGFSKPKEAEWYLTITDGKKDRMMWHSDDSDKYNLSAGLVFRTEQARDLRIKYNEICAKVERAYCEVTGGYTREELGHGVYCIPSYHGRFNSLIDLSKFQNLAGADNIEIASRPWLDYLRKETGK